MSLEVLLVEDNPGVGSHSDAPRPALILLESGYFLLAGLLGVFLPLFLLGSFGRLLPNEPRYILPRRVLRSPLPTWLYSC